MPIMTDQPAPPPEILEVVRCSCKKDCSTKRCTCKKHGLPCTDICGECCGTSCTNSQLPDFSDEYDPEGKNKPGTDIGGARTKSHREGVKDPGWIKKQKHK